MTNTATPLPRFTDTEQATLRERTRTATSALREAERRHTDAATPLLLVALAELFREYPCLRRVHFEPTSAYDDNDWYPTTRVGCKLAETADQQLAAQIEEEWEELAQERHPVELDEMLPERSITRDQLTTALIELKRTLATTGRTDG